MTTGTLILPIAGAILPDGSTNNAAAQFQRTKSSAAAPSAHFVELLFDAAADEHAFWSFRIPADYSSGLVCKLQWKANATANSCVWVARLAATTADDTDTPNEHAFAAANSATTATNTTEARRLNETSITMTNADSVAAGDFCTLLVHRDADNGSDSLTVDAELVAVSLEYTTA